MFGAASVKQLQLSSCFIHEFQAPVRLWRLRSLIVIRSKLLVNKPTTPFVHRNTHTRYSLMNNAWSSRGIRCHGTRKCKVGGVGMGEGDVVGGSNLTWNKQGPLFVWSWFYWSLVMVGCLKVDRRLRVNFSHVWSECCVYSGLRTSFGRLWSDSVRGIWCSEGNITTR